MTFQGFPAEAFTFYQRLEADNSRSFWDAHKSGYQSYVREPVRALVDELEAVVRQTWQQLIPLCDWLVEQVGPPRA